MGAKTVTLSASASSARRRTGWRLTWIRAVPLVGMSASTSTARPAIEASARTTARSVPPRTRTSRVAPRIDFWVASHPTASSTDVLPAPLGPRSTVRPSGSGWNSASVKQRKSVSHSVEMATVTAECRPGWVLDRYDTRTGMSRYR